MDLGFVGPIFTWNNRQSFLNRVSKRLDRALCSSKWRGMVPNTMIYHKATLASDHKILHLSFDLTKPKLKRPFRLGMTGTELRQEIGDHLIDYFSNLLSTSNPDPDQTLMDVIPLMVTQEDNDTSTRSISHEEIWLAIKNIGFFKALGPDGFQAASVL
ncbi:hypothetical protein IFM89_006029 [Coptis chinensis]|uniref:Uncharacterized protein n=1 Tax=Coptis chinensis TaxID=261450 RepID=A0A835I119_9MAGN|nr:hypothetical protein IFM89_006029 [Coptis chinensis]